MSEASATDHTLLPVVSGQCQDSVEQCMEEETSSSSRKEWWEGGELSERQASLCSLKRWPQWPDTLSLVSNPKSSAPTLQRLRLTVRPLAHVSSGRLTIQTRSGKMAQCFREILGRGPSL